MQEPQSVLRQKLWMDCNQRLEYLLDFSNDQRDLDWRYELSYLEVGQPGIGMRRSHARCWKRFDSGNPKQLELLRQLGLPEDVFQQKMDEIVAST